MQQETAVLDWWVDTWVRVAHKLQGWPACCCSNWIGIVAPVVSWCAFMRHYSSTAQLFICSLASLSPSSMHGPSFVWCLSLPLPVVICFFVPAPAVVPCCLPCLLCCCCCCCPVCRLLPPAAAVGDGLAGSCLFDPAHCSPC